MFSQDRPQQNIQMCTPSLDRLEIPAQINDLPKWATWMKPESVIEWETFVHDDNIEALKNVDTRANPCPLHALHHGEPVQSPTHCTDVRNTLERFNKESTTPQVCMYCVHNSVTVTVFILYGHISIIKF